MSRDKIWDSRGTNCNNVQHECIMCTPIIRKVHAIDFDMSIDMYTYNKFSLIRLFNKVLYTCSSILKKIEAVRDSYLLEFKFIPVSAFQFNDIKTKARHRLKCSVTGF